MDYIRITEENINEDICCAMSNKQSFKKKEWLMERFKEGLVFLKSTERGKCFIEYIPSEYAWLPLIAKDYMVINCLWVSGSLKGHGYSSDLLNECIKDAKEKGKKGLCILSSEKRKKEFLADPKYLSYKGFIVADRTDADIALYAYPFEKDESLPKFKDCAKKLSIEEKGWVLYYSNQCPFTDYWVNRVSLVAKEHEIPLKTILIDTREAAQNMPCPVSMYALFKDGKFITHGIQSDKKFLTLQEKIKAVL